MDNFSMTGVVQRRGRLIIKVHGELDMHTAATLREGVERMWARHIPTRIVVSLVGVTFIDTYGFATLRELARNVSIVVFHGEASRTFCDLFGGAFAEPTNEEQQFLERVPLEKAA